MKKGIIFSIIGIFIVGFIALFVKAKQWVKEIKYGVASGVKLQKISPTSIQVYLPVYFYNPTPLSFILSNLDLKVYFNGYYVSSITAPANYKIVKKKYSTYPLTLDVEPEFLLKLLQDNGSVINDPDWTSKVNVKVIGSAKIDLGLIKINDFPINFEEPLKSYVG